MEKMKKQRKGFTLTELAIVIAVIAILIAVLVPTFVSLINKANESADKQLVKNLNTALSIDEATNGQSETMSQAVATAEANGYNVANLNPTSSGYNIMWDQESNRFFLVNEDNEVVYADSSTGLSEGTTVSATYTYWRIVESESDYTNDNVGYSLYITTDEISAVESKGGVEYAEGVTSTSTSVTAATANTSASTEGKALASAAIKTASGASTVAPVIIKTNGGTLSVSITGDGEAKHYGTAEAVEVNSGSYVSYATVTANVEIKNDSVKVTITESSEVSAIYVTATSSTNISITISSTNEISVGASDSTVAGKLNSIVTSSSSSATTVVTTVCNDVALLYFAAGDGTAAHPYEIATATQLANIGNLSDTMYYYDSTTSKYTLKYLYFELTADIKYNFIYADGAISTYFNGQFDGNNHSITIVADQGGDSQGYGTYWFFTAPVDTTIKDLTIYQNSYNISITYGWKFSNAKLTFSNVNMGDSSCVGTSIEMFRNASGYIHYFSGTELTFDSCTNYYSLYSDNSEMYSAVFVGAYCRVASNPAVTFKNCVNYGDVTGSYAGLYFGNDGSGNVLTNADSLTVESCTNYGVITYWTNGGLSAYASVSTTVSTASGYSEYRGAITNKLNSGTTQGTTTINNTTLTGSIASKVDGTLALTYDSSKALTITKATSDVGKYALVYSSSAKWTDSNGNTGTQYIAIEIELNPTFGEDDKTWAVANNYNLTVNGIKFYDKDSYIASISGKTESNWTTGLTIIELSNIDSNKATAYYDSSNGYIVVDFSNMSDTATYVANGQSSSCKVVAYDSDGSIVAIAGATKEK